MKRPFIHEDFLLQNRWAVELYHRHAAPMPIIDYHSHSSPSQIATDHRFANLTEIWLNGDHYKWRAMRSNGVAERFCTGDASDWEKFEKWAETVPFTLRNPIYHWTHLELKKPFGLTGLLLGPDTAQHVWDFCNERLARPEMSCRGIIRQWDVRMICTTDDPADSLEFHQRMQGDKTMGFQTLPTFRPDAALVIENTSAWNAWLDRLSAAANIDVCDYDALLRALRNRAEFFAATGCRLSDHGLDQMYAEDFTNADVRAAFSAARAGRAVSRADALKFRSAIMLELGLIYHDLDWTMQFHLGPLRQTNSRMRRALGADTGHDTMGDVDQARPMARFLDRLDEKERLPRTILYNINPRDNELFAAMIGNFQDGRMPGKLQHGSAWWFMDQKDGMERQIDALSNLGLLSRFVGMLTDSRSFLSYSRHEYFRRILCNKLGLDIEQGLLPDDTAMIGRMVEDICFNNAARYFGFADIAPQRS